MLHDRELPRASPPFAPGLRVGVTLKSRTSESAPASGSLLDSSDAGPGALRRLWAEAAGAMSSSRGASEGANREPAAAAGPSLRLPVGPLAGSCATMSSLTCYRTSIEKPPLQVPIWGSMLPFWNPTGVFPRPVTVTPTPRKGCPLVVCVCLLSIQHPSALTRVTRTRRRPRARPDWPGELGKARCPSSALAAC